MDNILGRLRIEHDQPKADVVWGMLASALADMVTAGFFQPYTPKGFEKLDRRFSDPLTPPPLGRSACLGERPLRQSRGVGGGETEETGTLGGIYWIPLIETAYWASIRTRNEPAS